MIALLLILSTYSLLQTCSATQLYLTWPAEGLASVTVTVFDGVDVWFSHWYSESVRFCKIAVLRCVIHFDWVDNRHQA